MDEKEAEARPVMGTIFLVITGCYFSGSKPLAKLTKLNPKPIKMLLQYWNCK